jgi:lipid II isoglutaminyl synthase (glutamine-hydrolysing)
MNSSGGSRITVALLFPDLLGTYGDSGNAVILAQRLKWRGIPAEVLTVRSGEPVPESCELYVVGGGEDLPQALAAKQLGTSAGPLHRAVDAGSAVLAVCAGLQILGRSFVGPDGKRADGLGLFDCETIRGTGRRSVGEIVVDPDPELRLPVLTGYENHASTTVLGPSARPVGQVVRGIGNGGETGVDGCRSGRIFGTYLHGPVLARNPALADLILSWVVGELEPLDDSECDDLRAERLAAAGLNSQRPDNPRFSWRRANLGRRMVDRQVGGRSV